MLQLSHTESPRDGVFVWLSAPAPSLAIPTLGGTRSVFLEKITRMLRTLSCGGFVCVCVVF